MWLALSAARAGPVAILAVWLVREGCLSASTAIERLRCINRAFVQIETQERGALPRTSSNVVARQVGEVEVRREITRFGETPFTVEFTRIPGLPLRPSRGILDKIKALSALGAQPVAMSRQA